MNASMYKNLLSPIKIGSCEIKNRFVMPPMDNELGNLDGTVSDKVIAYFEARAKGGFGLIVIDYTTVHPYGRPGARTLGIWDDKFIPGMAELTTAMHNHGAKVFLQLHHAGRTCAPTYTLDGRIEGPSAVSEPTLGIVPTEMTREDIYDRIQAFGDAALRAKKAGFDGVELHAATCYLLANFISGQANKRVDEFGGTLEGRTRIIKLIVEDIRAKCGSDFPVTARLTGNEGVNGGMPLAEVRAIAKLLEAYGVNGLNYTCGIAANAQMAISPAQTDAGYNLYVGEAVKKAVNIPVMVGGRINDPLIAEDAIESGAADMVIFGRGSIADPELPNKVAAGCTDEICFCVGCLERCVTHVRNHHAGNTGIGCMANPFAGRETELVIEPAETKKKVVVIGAGPAGLETAWIAAKRGHDVVVFEKDGNIGGQFRLAAIPPYKQELTKVVGYQFAMCKKYGVDVRFNTEATKELILAEQPDEIVVATGAKPLTPPIPGLSDIKFSQAHDVLAGKLAIGRSKVLIVGGGEVGIELADFLGERYNDITVVEMGKHVAVTKHPWAKTPLVKRVTEEYGVKLLTKTKVLKFIEGGAVCETVNGEITLDGFDHIILALGSVPYKPLAAELAECGVPVHVIGDANGPLDVVKANYEAASLACVL